PRFEIKAGGKSEIFMKRARIAINAPVLTSAIRIDAGFKTHIRALVIGNNALRPVANKLSRLCRILRWVVVAIRFDGDTLKPVWRVNVRSPGRKLEWIAAHSLTFPHGGDRHKALL